MKCLFKMIFQKIRPHFWGPYKIVKNGSKLFFNSKIHLRNSLKGNHDMQRSVIQMETPSTFIFFRKISSNISRVHGLFLITNFNGHHFKSNFPFSLQSSVYQFVTIHYLLNIGVNISIFSCNLRRAIYSLH